MPGATLPPRNTGMIGGAIGRVERIERLTVTPPPTAQAAMIFSYPGTLANSVESPPWYVPGSGMISSVRVSLLAAASANHTVKLRVNAVDQQTFTLTTGNSTSVTAATISVAIGDYVTIETLSVVDTNLSVEVRLR